MVPDDLSLSNNYRENIEWEFRNLDDDPAIEITQTEKHFNNWFCTYYSTLRLDWDAAEDRYLEAEIPIEYPDTDGCLWTKAEMLTFRHDFEAAIPLYERGILLSEPTDYTLELLQYIQIKLALAYAITNQPDKAVETLNSIAAPSSSGIADLMTAITRDYLPERNKVAFCAAMYNFFQPDIDIDYYGDDYGPLSSINGSGCDIEWLLSKLLDPTQMPAEVSPVDWLSSLRIPVRAYQQMDLNQDGRGDWLIWLEARIPPFIFVSQNESGGYEVFSKPYLTWTAEEPLFQLMNLPDQSGVALFWFDQADRLYNDEGQCPEEPHGVFSIWRLHGSDLERLVREGICEEVNLSDIIQNQGRAIHVWVSSDIHPYSSLVAGVYSWDDTLKRYVLTLPPPETYQMQIEEQQRDRDCFDMRNAVIDLKMALDQHSDIEAGLEAASDLVTAHPDCLTATQLQEFQYLRALALEALDRPDEALAEYVAIYAAAPESAWGQLAWLHIDCVANCAG